MVLGFNRSPPRPLPGDRRVKAPNEPASDYGMMELIGKQGTDPFPAPPMNRNLAIAAAVVVLTWAEPPAVAQPPGSSAADSHQTARPDQFHSTFSFGYGGDDFPDDPAQFEALVRRIAGEGGFSAVLCGYSGERARICEAHGLRMMVDLLHPAHHVYRAPEAAAALLDGLRQQPGGVVMGYHLWSDRIGGSVDGRLRDIRHVRGWDPTRPTYSASYRGDSLEHLSAASAIFGWYDFHWKRGIHRRFPQLLHAWRLAREHGTVFYELLSTDSGRPGAGNFNRSLWSVNTGIACGMKGCLWFIGSRQMNPRTGEWTGYGLDINRVNAEVMPLRHQLMPLGVPVAVFSTPVTMDMNNRPVAAADDRAPVYPPGLHDHAIPPGFPVQAGAGEFLMGVFESAGDDDGAMYLFIANHNAYAAQQVRLHCAGFGGAEIFDRGGERWRALPLQRDTIDLPLGAAGGELLRLLR